MNDGYQNSVTTETPTHTTPSCRGAEVMTDFDIEFALSPEDLDAYLWGPQLLPIRVIKRDGQLDAFLDYDCGGAVSPWRIPIRHVGPNRIVLTLPGNLRAFWLWNLFDRND